MTSSQDKALTKRSDTASPEARQELERWQAALDDQALGFWRLLSVAGELFMLQDGERWGRRVLLGWAGLTGAIFVGSFWWAQEPISTLLAALDSLLVCAYIACIVCIFVVVSISAPLMIWRAGALRRRPLLEELPERRMALELIERRQHRAPLGLRRAIAQSFGPGIVISTTLVTTALATCIFVMTLVFGMSSTLLLAIAINGVLFFSTFFILIVLPLSGAGLLAWTGKRVLDRRRSIRAELEGPEHITPGALTQASNPAALPQGGLSSLEPSSGALTAKEPALLSAQPDVQES